MRRSLAEIELEARGQRTLMEIDYLYEVGLLSPVEARRRRRLAYELFQAALADLRAWEAARGC